MTDSKEGYKSEPIADWENRLIEKASENLHGFSRPLIIAFYLLVMRGVPVIMALGAVVAPMYYASNKQADERSAAEIAELSGLRGELLQMGADNDARFLRIEGDVKTLRRDTDSLLSVHPKLGPHQ